MNAIKKLLSILLILSVLFTLVSCKDKKKEINVCDESIEKYRIVYDSEGLDYNKRAAEYIRDKISALTGYSLEIVDDSEPASSREIVVGETSRDISEELDEDTEGFEFAMLAKGGTIALEADYFVIAAAAYYLIDTYFSVANDVEIPDGMKLISTDERAYRFFVPKSWIDNGRTEISAAYASEGDGSNVSLQMYMTGDESKTVSEYFAECEDRYQTIFDAYTLLSDTDIEMSGISAKQYIYTAVIGGVEYKQMQAIVMKGAVYYVMTYTALPEYFDLHMDDVNMMIKHFYIGRK